MPILHSSAVTLEWLIVAGWLRRYNGQRPHETFGNLTPHWYLMVDYQNPLLLKWQR